MKFDDLDRSMRVYETAADYCVLPGIFMVARLDGRNFTRLTKDVCHFEAPFDERFRDLMVETTESLMNSGFRVIYAYTESDEISLLFDREEKQFGRKLRKYNSTLAGEASAKFSLLLRQVAAFSAVSSSFRRSVANIRSSNSGDKDASAGISDGTSLCD